MIPYMSSLIMRFSPGTLFLIESRISFIFASLSGSMLKKRRSGTRTRRPTIAANQPLVQPRAREAADEAKQH